MKGSLLAMLTLALAACARQPTDISVATGPNTRELPALSLSVGQQVDIQPDAEWEYDSLPVRSSSAIAFLGMGHSASSQAVQVYHFQARAIGNAIVTIRFTNGDAALHGTIDVGPAATHGSFTQISTGFDLETCALATDGAAYCWGGPPSTYIDVYHDQATVYANTPTSIAGGIIFAEISRGFEHACGLTTDGAAYCWGDNGNGQLGDGTTDSSTVPVPVTGGLTFKAVNAGSYHTCGVTTEGAIYCWGTTTTASPATGPAATTIPVRSSCRVIRLSSRSARGPSPPAA